MIRTLHRERSLHSRLYLSERISLFTKVSEEARDDLVECQPIVERLVISRSHVNTAAFAKLNPAPAREFAIRRTDSVGVDIVAAREVTRARQTLGNLQIVADNSENDLCNQLLADGNFTIFRDP